MSGSCIPCRRRGREDGFGRRGCSRGGESAPADTAFGGYGWEGEGGERGWVSGGVWLSLLFLSVLWSKEADEKD